ncbi:toxic anion resistance protein [Paenibacillus thiaminolyticus]|uniref:Toxic anion resistance protein n=1 Tax=Paenibacillus thiaminolyticus TaxID=49283 RepID=A0AAP9DY61_PANTH|nr:toxic anion resistance protein [Paenibacillus thiaminolyticus]MCY9538855.1 toxic anion resistance protein [Paenibacillus thiaminolyticus]MCY9605571.1 toxic anion resistance protein [Paenibacillus thiaminolyticus]MCY9610948.1 toxic anion resistance protein [Paenibacillus thiaminolyticus]MCY9616706.1 toxic anion resistance protein [Paenibacillus thiaminolyticus]MCY9621697.1 toxic anion resistance protein [Paenibacillus thiaminolyticus]
MSFSMEVASPEEIQAAIEQEVKPVPEEVAKLKEMADANVATIMTLDIESLENRKEILQSIDAFGMNTMRSSSEKNALLQVSIGRLSKTGDEGGDVAKGLAELHTQLRDLDPGVVDFAKTGFLGKLFNPLRAYFLKYQKADSVIADIVVSLEKGKTTLKNDNTTLEIEQQTLRDLTKKLQKEIQLGTMMDESIEAQIELAKLRNEDPDKIRFITEEVLFPLRQRVMDLQQMLVVNQQGIMAIEVVVRNNKELIRGVDRAKNVTISALKISVTVASALYNQKIVLKKIELLNQTTNNLIASTSRMLKNQGAEIQKQSLEANISVDTLKQAFSDVMSALDSISAYKQDALPKMRHTINQFRELADDGEKQIQRLERGHKLGL